MSNKDLQLVAAHHSTAPAFRERLLYMGKTGKPWKKADDNGYGDYSWQYWSGSWPQPPSHWGWEPEQSPQRALIFPAYDQVKGGGKSSKTKGQDWRDTEGDPEAYLVNTIQDNINKARRAEQKVRALIATRNKKAEMWKRYVDSMKASYLQELQRHQRDVTKVETELETALAQQEEARKILRSTFNFDKDPRQMERAAQETAWQEMTGQWRQEREQAEDANAVVKRAMEACGVDRDKLLQAVTRAASPRGATRAAYAPPPGLFPDPWAAASPSMTAPPGAEAVKTPTTTPTRAKSNSAKRQPIKPAVVPPVKKSPQEAALKTKLDHVRERLVREGGDTFRPTDGLHTQKDLPVKEPASIEIVDDDDLMTEEPDAPPDGLHNLS